MGAYEMMKDAISIAQKADNLELMKSLLETQKKISDLQDENKKFKEEIERLQNLLNEEGVKELKKGCYYFNGDGPFCTVCYDDAHKKIRMNSENNNMGTIYNVCHKCNNKVVESEYEYNINMYSHPVSFD